MPMQTPSTQTAPAPGLQPGTVDTWRELLGARQYGRLSASLLQALLGFYQFEHDGLNSALKTRLDEFLEQYLAVFCDRAFIIPDADAAKYISLNSQLAYLVACSSYVNTDRWLRELEAENAPVEKLLALYSIRNRYRLPIEPLFRGKPALASHWYAMQTFTALPPASEWLMENARRHYRDMPETYRVVSPGTVSAGYFDITYIDPENEAAFKQKLNCAIQRLCTDIHWEGARNPRSVAVITRRWFTGSAVYRALYPYLEAISGDYSLTLVHLGELNTSIDTSLFSEVRSFPRLADVRQLSAQQRSAVLDQDWSVAYFPDVGMDVETVFLGNCRLAPVQIMGYGHPASMHGGQVDYFISGTESEIPELAGRYFSERLVMLPGTGMIPVWPQAPVNKQVRLDNGRVIVNCPWTLMKMNAGLIGLLAELLEESDVPLFFRFFTDIDKSDRWSGPVYQADLEARLGADNFELVSLTGYRKFLAEMAKGDFTVVPYPFGGYNTVIDSLYVGLPTATREGVHGYNRFPAALLRKAGFSELVASDREVFKQRILRLASDSDWRADLVRRIGETDLAHLVTEDLDPGVFRRALDYLLEHDETLRKRPHGEPVYIR